MSEIIANLDPAKVIVRVSECIRRLMEAGLSYDALQKPIDDPKFRQWLVERWMSGGVELADKLITSLNPRWLYAREILGKNFFGVEEAIKHFGVNPTKQQLAFLAEVPFNEAVLQECKNSHILVAVFPMSILDIRGKVDRKLFYSHEEARCNKQAFAKDCGEIDWHLVRKTPVPNSTYKFWSEQQNLLTKNEETPKAQVMTYTIIGHYLSTDERLFQNVYVWTSDVDSDGDHVNLGNFDKNGLNINNWYGSRRSSVVGLASERKS
jgi:hypothetical protein